MKKISVIIAAYNAQQYLDQTMVSILNQSMDLGDYEVIIVDDGSTDETPDILRRYEKDYDAVHVISKENGGPSSARNLGLDHASGEYIYFLDADDIVDTHALEYLYNTLKTNDADLVIAKYDYFDQYGTIEIEELDDLVLKKDINILDSDILRTFALWNKMFSSRIIKEHHIRFAPVSYSEDGVFLMEYIFYCRKITGLDHVVLHYRRFYGDNSNAITSSISSQKIRDYVEAHRLIIDGVANRISGMFPQYDSFEKLMEENGDIHQYMNFLCRKELQILIDRFYAAFWKISNEDRRIIAEEIRQRLSMTDIDNITQLTERFPFMPLPTVHVEVAEVLEHALYTMVLYGDKSDKDSFLSCLKTLCNQNLLYYKIIIPVKMEVVVKEEGLEQENIIYIDCGTEPELFNKALSGATTPYIMFCSSRMLYAKNILRIAFNQLSLSRPDFAVYSVLYNSFGISQPTSLSRLFKTSISGGLRYGDHLHLDGIFGNKIFLVSFFRERLPDFDFNSENGIERVFRQGAYKIYENCSIYFDGSDDEYTEYVTTPKTKEYIESTLAEGPDDLNCQDLKINKETTALKLLILEKESREYYLLDKFLKYSKKRIINRVLFFSIRADNKLEGNAKALYPYIKGRKKICASRLPHDEKTVEKMIKLIMTSKVIITDDYVKYLRYFPLRPEQRVIQLWHACGVFKMFGRRGTNLSLPIDMATHAQYNLVAVSSDSIRTVYADAFDIDLKKVKALGSPRTDTFFDPKYKKKVCGRVFRAHPEFMNKSIIVYAPTFRDMGCDRSEFHPELDFDLMSKELGENKELIICPHPIMKNKILDKEYSNIHVMRDFSTNDYMLISDKLITDYSSVIFEYALLNKPIAFFCYDLDIYDRGFYLRYPDDLPGEVYTNQTELMSFINGSDSFAGSDRRELFIEKYMSACDGHSCERIAKIVNTYMGR